MFWTENFIRNKIGQFHFDSAFLFTSFTELIMLLKTDDYS